MVINDPGHALFHNISCVFWKIGNGSDNTEGTPVYRDYFKLRERPFTHAPGQRFFVANPGVADAITRLQHVLTARDAIAVLSGGPGVGKTAIVEQALSAMGERVVAVRVDMRYAEPEDLYVSLLLALGEDTAATGPAKALHGLRQAMARFVREGRRVVLSLDTGGMTADLAKHLLRVTNLAGEQDCQLNIVLMGPHSLHQQLDLPALIQLRQRAAYRHRVRPLTLSETDRYIRHQIEAAGGDPVTTLTTTVAAAVYCYVAGVPRLVNTLMDSALSHACINKQERPDGNQIKRTAEDLGWKPLSPPQSAADAANAVRTASPGGPRTPTAERGAAPAGAGKSAQTGRLAVLVPPPSADRARAAAGVAAAAGGNPPRPVQPAPTEATLQLRGAGRDNETARTGRYPSLVSLASPEPARPTSIFRQPDGAPRPAATPAVGRTPPPPIAMDPIDTSATGMLRLQDLDERFAETIFGKDLDEAAATLRKGPDKS
jgi:type II secretory pathway predicted ATPase ExeA